MSTFLPTPNFFAGLEGRIAALQARDQEVIRLDIGSPDLPPPPAVIAALSQSAADPRAHGYGSHRGTAALRQAWAAHYQQQYAIHLDPEHQVLPLMGSKEGIAHLALAILRPGDLVLVPDPGYMTYIQGAHLAGARVYPVSLQPQPQYAPPGGSAPLLPDLDNLPSEVLSRARLLWLNYPHNPTASVAPLEFFARVIDFARRHKILVVHDAAYTQVTFDGYQAPSLLQIPGALDAALEFNTLSKSHNMAGWRVAAALGNAEVLAALLRVKSAVDSGHFLPVLNAATLALATPSAWIAARNRIYQERRDQMVSALHALGLPAALPQASIYVWSPVPPGWGSESFTEAVLEQAQVSLTPGTIFGAGGEGYVRFSLTAPGDRIAAAMERLKYWFQSHL